MIKIAFFSLKDNIGCTSIALHTANYLAGIANTSIAFIEPKKKGLNLNGEGESKFAKCNVDYEDDGTFVLNSVRFYPSKRRKAWVYDTFELCDEEIAPTEDIQIYDFGKVGFLHEFEDDFDKIYLCTDGNSLSDEVTFTKDTKTNPDVILFGASKETFNKYQQMGFRCTLIGDKKEERIPRNFAAQLEITLRLKGLTPPAYHSDWTYAKLEFDYKPVAKPEEKQGFLSKMFGKKEKAKKDEKQQEEPENKEIITSDIDVVDKKEVRKANEFKINEFIAVPVPEEDVLEESVIAEEVTEEKATKEVSIENIPASKDVLEDVLEAQARVQAPRPNKSDEIEIKADEATSEKELEAKETKEFQAKEKQTGTNASADSDIKGTKKKAKDAAKQNVTPGQVRGILGKVIKYIIKNVANTCNIYIVTKDKKLFIFDDVNVFFAKLELLKREIRNLDKVHYVIITHFDEVEPTIISDDTDLDDVFTFLEALDSDLREHRLTDDDIRKHKELVLFEEILLA